MCDIKKKKKKKALHCSLQEMPYPGKAQQHPQEQRYPFLSDNGIGRFSEAGLHEWMPFVIFRARSREKLQRHFRADFWVGFASRCV